MTSSLHYIIVFTIFVATESKPNFEMSTSQDKLWSYINITCDVTKSEKHKLNLKTKDFSDLYYDFDHSRLSRSISRTDQSKKSEQLHTTRKANRSFNDAVYRATDIKSTADQSTDDEPVRLEKNVINGSERAFLYTNCNTIVFKLGAVSDVVKALFINSDGSLILNEGWFGSNITVLKIYANKVQLPEKCEWLPPSVLKLDLAGVALKDTDLSFCKSSLQTLSLVETKLNNASFCFDMLENLDLSSNNLQSLEFGKKCTKSVTEFKASNNKIGNWSSCGFPNLVHLSIDHNFIRNVDFSKCSSHKLFSLDASHNKISKFPTVLPESLSTLILSFNKIENISAVESSFKILDLSHNLIRRLVKGVFILAWELSELNLSHNLLSVIHSHDFSGLRQLNSLDLSHNKIQKIRPKAFSSLVNLKILHINGNSLHTLDTRLLAYLPKKIKFIAHGNPWSCSCYLLAELSKITRSSCLPNCHKQNKLKCKQGRTWLAASTILQKCLNAVQSNLEAGFSYPATPASDEDTSEEKKELPLLSRNSGVILIVLMVLGAASIKMYTERKWLKRHCCNCLQPSAAKNGNGLTTIGANPIHESESETEF